MAKVASLPVPIGDALDALSPGIRAAADEAESLRTVPLRWSKR